MWCSPETLGTLQEPLTLSSRGPHALGHLPSPVSPCLCHPVAHTPAHAPSSAPRPRLCWGWPSLQVPLRKALAGLSPLHAARGPHRSPCSRSSPRAPPPPPGPGTERALRSAGLSGSRRAARERPGRRQRSAALCPLGSGAKLASGGNEQARLQLAHGCPWSIPTPENTPYCYILKNQ